MNTLNHSRLIKVAIPVILLISCLLMAFAIHADELQDATQLFKQGQHAKALSAVNNYLVNKPRDAQGRFLKGLIFTEQNKTADAIKVFSDLTQDYPELPEPYNNLAVLYAGQGQFDKAKSALEMAIRTHPSYATAHENLGDIYAKLASQAYDRALQLDSSNTTTQTKLAMIQDLFSDKPQSKSRPVAPRTPAIGIFSKPVASVEPTAVKAPVASVAPVVAAAAPKSKPASETTSNADKAVQDSVEAWASAWSSKNVKRYLSYYAADFKTPNGESRKSWTVSRHERISKPKNISVKISHVRVNYTDDSHATVKFHQDYRASNFKASGSKTLLMVKSGSSWFIQEEQAN